MAIKRVLNFISVFILVHITLCSKLNVPRVLLPIFEDFSTKFVLEVTEGGCYTWTTTRKDIINLSPVDVDPHMDCSIKAVIATATKDKERNIAVILAEDINTKQILRCDIIVDVIHSLAIVTTTKELFMDEAPEAFEVRAYDIQGNEFTTLEGVEFDWHITCLGSNKDTSVLQFMTFNNSPYEMPCTVEELEKQNKRGHITLLKGIQTGSAKVSVNLPHEEYKHIKPCEVQLSVIANLIIIPGDVYIMVGDSIRCQIIHMNNGKMEQVTLENSQYYLDVDDKSIVSIGKSGDEVVGLQVGKTIVVLRDQNTVEADVGLKLPSTTVNVVTPTYITLNILPYRNWAILLSEHHNLVAELYSSNDHKIHLGSNSHINIEVGDIFHVHQRSANGSWLTGWAKQEGTTPVRAILKTVIHPTLGEFKVDPEIDVVSELRIYPPISLIPSEVILPWDPEVKPVYEMQIKAIGGDGKFLWNSNNHSLGVVTQSGFVKTFSYGPLEISAAMTRNHHNKAIAQFHILAPSHLEIIEYIMEAEVGSLIFLHIALYTDDFIGQKHSKVPFTKCQELPFKIKSSDSSFVHNKTAIVPPVGISCGNVAVISHNVGISKITVSYNVNGKVLQDSVTVTTFQPLRLINPRHCEIVLAVGTSANLLIAGGPRPVIGRPSLHKRKVVSENEAIVLAKDHTAQHVLGGQDITVLNVLCLRLGVSEVTLTISNNPTTPNCKNQESFSSVTVICGKPRSVFLHPVMKISDAQSCPMDLTANRIVVQSYQDIELDVIVTDNNGRRFLNISTLKFDWNVNPAEFGELGSSDGVFTRIFKEGTVEFSNQSYQTVSPISRSGVVEVTTTVVGYRLDKLKELGIKPEWPEFITEDERGHQLLPITSAIHLYLVDNAFVTPNITSMYNHPGNMKLISVHQGSGYYELALSADNIANVRYLDNSREIEIIPVNNGELQISLQDLCLVSQPVLIKINVVSVGTIKIEMSDKVEISKCITCVVKLYDENENLLILPNLDMIDLEEILQDDIASLKRLPTKEDGPSPVGDIHYIITGEKLGNTKLSFAVGDKRSATVNLQVFPPLRIYPRNATLTLGAVFQFTATGGPQPDCTMEYSSTIPNIADINAIGLTQGSTLGHTKVIAQAVGVNSITGLKVVYSEDQVDLHVVNIAGIRISSPLTRFRIGSTIPVWVTGIPEQISPMVLGSIEPPLRFEWDVEDSEIIQIRGIFKPQGITHLPEDAVSIQVTGLAPGRSTLHVSVVVPGAAADRANRKRVVYSCSLDLEVFENLILTAPRGVSGDVVLMAPQSTLKLETNLDSSCTLQYMLSSSKDTTSDKSLSIPNPVITVSETGLLKSFNNVGKAMILVTATDDYGLKQSLSIIVEIKPIHYILLNIIANWHVSTSTAVNTIPVGAEFELKATYHDNTGSIFTAASSQLKLRSTRFDLVRIRPGHDNSSFIISTRKIGFTIIKVWIRGLDKTADYIKLHVEQLISPKLEHLTTGDIICFWSPLVTSFKQVGIWTSSEKDLLVIDNSTGIGSVIGVQGGQISVGHFLHPGTAIHLQFVPATKILMLTPESKILTNAPTTAVYRVPLVLLSEKSGHKETNLLSGWPCQDVLHNLAFYYPHTCHMEFTNKSANVDIKRIFEIQPGFLPETGQYTCDILPGVDYGSNISILNTNVSVWAQLDGTSIQAEPIDLHFLPAIFVPSELIMDSSYTGFLTITGLETVLNTVEVKPVDSKLLYIGNAISIDENVNTYEVSLLDYHWKLDELDEPMNVIVKSKLTGQIMKVHVRLQESASALVKTECATTKHSPLVSFIYHYRNSFAAIISMVVIFIITFYVYSQYLHPVINVNINPTRSLLDSTNHFRTLTQDPISPTRNHICAATAAYIQQAQTSTNRSPVVNRDPVYGDPSSFYSTSPELRRNRRFM